MKLRQLLSLVLVLCAVLTIPVGAAAQLPSTYHAVAFNYAIQGQAPNTFTFFPLSVCRQAAEGLSVFPFATNAPVYIADSVPANNELLTPSAVVSTSSQCGVTIAAQNTHNSFQMLSGTAGLQEALNAVTGSATLPVAIVLDRAWYQAASAVGTAATIIGTTAKGSTSKYLVDITTAPWTIYTWQTSAYAKVGVTGATCTAWVNGLCSHL